MLRIVRQNLFHTTRLGFSQTATAQAVYESAAAPKNLESIVEQISQLNLVETASLVDLLKVKSSYFRFVLI